MDEALTIEYNPKTNKVRLIEPEKGLMFSNIERTFQIDENEVFYGQLFEEKIRNEKGCNR